MNAHRVRTFAACVFLAAGLLATVARGDGYPYFYASGGDYGWAWSDPAWEYQYTTGGEDTYGYGDYDEVPVYRLASRGGAHMFSVDAGEIAALLASGAWVNEGVAFWALSGEYGYRWTYSTGGYTYEETEEATPLYRLSSRTGGDYFFTASFDEARALLSSGAYNYDGITCFVGGGEYDPPYGDPVYRLRSSGQYLFTVSEAEKNALVASGAWTLEGVAFYALSPVVTITLSDDILEEVPTLRFETIRGGMLPDINPPYVDGYVFEGYGWRYYTEGDNGDYGWQYEYAYDACGNSLITADWNQRWYALWRSPSDKAALKPVYRVRCAVNGDYLFTLDPNERDVLDSFPEWTYEGVAFNAYDDFAPGTVPLYRFTNTATGEHFMTANETEKNVLGASSGWSYDGILCFVSAASTGSTAAVSRLFSPYSGFHLFTMTEAEKNHLVTNGWRNEGIAFYVWP